MDDITGEEYEKVLQYMQAVSEEDFSTAVTAMRAHQFNLQLAISRKYDSVPSSRDHHAALSQAEDEEIVRKYIDFSERKNREWSLGWVLWDIAKYLLSALFSLLTSFLPSSLYVRFFGTPFEKIYGSSIRQYTHRPLAYYLPKTKNISSKSVLVLVAPRQLHPDVVAFLSDQTLQRKISQNFYLTCYVAGSEELGGVQGAREGPLIVALRWNIFQELKQVGRQKQIKRINAELLGRWFHEARNLFKRDGNVLVKYRNFLARAHGIHYEEQEEEQVNLLQRDQEKREIHQQNQAYQAVQEQTRKAKQAEAEQRRKAEEEQRARQELQEERKIRKMSIPDEPTEGEIIRLSFRCPDGSTVFRNFHANQKLELVFHWVQLNEEIQFEQEKRHFEIMYSYPPAPLSTQKDRLLSQVFQSSQEKVLIREL